MMEKMEGRSRVRRTTWGKEEGHGGDKCSKGID